LTLKAAISLIKKTSKKFNFNKNNIKYFLFRFLITMLQRNIKKNLYYPLKYNFKYKENMKRVKVEFEFIFRASPNLLYQFITTPACLVRWYCDEVEITEDLYSFAWNGAIEDAEMVDDFEDERVRFKWLDADDTKEYFEFKMYKSDVTLETVLEITDYCDAGDEKSTRDWWTSQMNALKQECGG
jgi:uncharacterized protein YndB with AHSA1/START domain